MTVRYWWVIITYIIMQVSGPVVVELFSIDKVEVLILYTIFSFAAALIIVLLLMIPDMKADYARQEEASKAGTIILWSFIGVFMAYFAQAIAVLIESKLIGITPGSENTQMIMDIARTIPIFMIVPAIMAPILEEIIFRKIIFGSLYSRTNFFIAALASAFIFGIIHGEPEHILIYASMGFVFAFLYVKTKSILTPIIVHMALNSISVIVQFNLDPEDFERMREQWEKVQMILIGG